MANRTDSDTFLTECEPYFLDGVLTIAEFVRQTQESVSATVGRHEKALRNALGVNGPVRPREYSEPDKLQKARATDGLYVGTKLKGPGFENAFFRYWMADPLERGIGAWIWLEQRKKMDHLAEQLDNLPDEPPEPVDLWEFDVGSGGSYLIFRRMEEAELPRLPDLFDQLITYYIRLLKAVGGIGALL